MTQKEVKVTFLTLPILLLSLLISPLTVAQSTRTHILKDFRGNVQIKKESGNRFQNLTEFSIGASLKNGDVFRLSGNATVIIICSNRQEKRLPSGKTTKVSQVCPLGARTQWNVGDNVQRFGLGSLFLPEPAPEPIRGLW